MTTFDLFLRPTLRALLVGLLLAATFGPLEAHGQSEPRRVADLETEDSLRGSLPSNFFVLDDRLFFSADDGANGTELWSTDGTAEGTAMILDLEPGERGSYSRHVGRLGERLIFEGRGVFWSTDGTAEGTTFLADPCPGVCSSFYEKGVELDGRLIFGGRGPEGIEPWVTDGTREGTQLLRDIDPGAYSSFPTHFARVGDRVVFMAGPRSSGYEPWATDGTPEGTYQLADICSGTCTSFAFSSATLNDRWIFTANDGVRGWEPWVSDGTVEGTGLLRDVEPGGQGSYPASWTRFGDLLFARIEHCTRDCILRTDGTTEGTYETSGQIATNRYPQSFAATADSLLIAARGLANEQELWASDGQSSGELILSSNQLTNLRFLGSAGGKAIASVHAGDYSTQYLLASDGSPEGTGTIQELNAFWSETLGDRVLISAGDPEVGTELFVTDGSAEGTSLLADIAPPRSDALLRHMVDWNGRLAFSSGDSDTETWITDGDTLELLQEGADIRELLPFGDQLVARVGGVDGLWFFDADGQQRQIELPRRPREMVVAGELLYFTLAISGQQIWVSDGTAEGTKMVADINPNWSSISADSTEPPEKISPPPLPPFPSNLMPVGNGVAFAAFQDNTPQLWYSEGTEESTRVLRTFQSTASPYYEWPRRLTHQPDRTFFTASEDVTGREVWTTDGTPEGTRLVADLVSGPDSLDLPLRVVPYAGGMAFADTPAEGRTVYLAVADSITALAHYPQPEAEIRGLATNGEQLYTWVEMGTESQLYLYEGVADSNRRLDPMPGPEKIASLQTIAPHGVLLGLGGGGGTAEGTAEGIEPWVTNGEQFRQLGDLNPGPRSSSPDHAILSGGRIFFEADDGETDRELWTMAASELFDDGCPTDELCLTGDRFRVEATWRTAEGESGRARTAAEAEDSALLWFFDADNWEMLIKVLDGCAINDHFWVFAAVSTDVGLTLQVTDLETTESWTWEKPIGTTTPALTATDAFATCP